ncbi:hypothetical protein [Priestia koreensis]|uniref:hypothetical protein n=1 Tax=Priestia koreensis TaxID=284581 RepID=UPI0020400C57|nr:hypothetical protein [Priestia koreensis]MCM3005693.1 hypothetical protein [Priestia koreensis]
MNANTEKIDIRFPKVLIKDIEDYQKVEDISNRSTAIFELIRKGLKTTGNINIKIPKGDSQRIDIRVPVSLLNKIEGYQEDNEIKTRSKALKQLVMVGLLCG